MRIKISTLSAEQVSAAFRKMAIDSAKLTVVIAGDAAKQKP